MKSPKKQIKNEVIEKVEKNIYKRGECSFQVKMTRAKHSVSKVFDTLNEALIWRDLQLAAVSLDVDEKRIFQSRANKRDSAGFSVLDALKKYEKEITPHKKGASVESTRIGKAKRTKLAKMSMYLVQSHHVEEFMNEIGGSSNNQRKYVSLISHLFKIAKMVWKKEVENPVTGKIVLPSNGRPRKRRLVGNEYTLLLKHLTGEAATLFAIAIETGMRQGEILKLEWKDISLSCPTPTAHVIDPKNGEDRHVPLSSVVIKNLKSLTRGVGNAKVFTITPRLLRTQWEKARAAAGIPDIRWHDLRHEGTSRLFEKGLTVLEASSVTGHKTLSMLQAYTHLSPSDIAKKLG